jgi:hypothetical protein
MGNKVHFPAFLNCEHCPGPTSPPRLIGLAVVQCLPPTLPVMMHGAETRIAPALVRWLAGWGAFSGGV